MLREILHLYGFWGPKEIHWQEMWEMSAAAVVHSGPCYSAVSVRPGAIFVSPKIWEDPGRSVDDP